MNKPLAETKNQVKVMAREKDYTPDLTMASPEIRIGDVMIRGQANCSRFVANLLHRVQKLEEEIKGIYQDQAGASL